MQAISIIGFSNSGKTTLISRLSECLEARGLKVAIAKHTHHELDKPDTDTALLMGPKRTIVGLSNTKDGKGEAMIHWGHPCFLRDLVPLLDADILLVEGGKTIGWLPRILCLRTTPELLTALRKAARLCAPSWRSLRMGTTSSPGCRRSRPKIWMRWSIWFLRRAFCCPRWIAELAGKRTVPP